MIRKLLCVLCGINFSAAIPELKLVHVLFSHKSYAPFRDVSDENGIGIPRNLSYEYFQSFAIDMPNEGKLNMYNLGSHLRDVYGEFLGDTYTNQIMKMRTSEYPLSMIAGQLVNAGLWLPTGDQQWDEGINWQPTPADYVAKEKDTLLLGMHCPSFVSEKKNALNTDKVRNILLSYSTFFESISQYTGLKVRRPSDIALLYSSLETKADLNQSLPYWASDIFPDGVMYNLTLLEYDLLTHTALQRKLNGGTMLKEIISNCLKYVYGMIPAERKIMLYSGDERNIVGVLKNLELWSPHIPSEGASVIFELYYDNSTKMHGIQVKYYTGVEGDTILLTIPNCTEICPLNTTLNRYFQALPDTEEILCSWKALSVEDDDILPEIVKENLASSYRSQSVLVIFLLMIVWSSNEII